MISKSYLWNLMPPCTGHTVTQVCSGHCQAHVPTLGTVHQAGCAPGAGRARTGPPSRHSLAKHSPRCTSLPWRPVAPRQPLPPGHGFPRLASPEGPGEGPCALLGRDGLPGPRFRGRPPWYGPSAPASRRDGMGTGWGTGRDGSAGAIQVSPVRRQHGPGLCSGSAAGGAPNEGSLPSPPGAPEPKGRTNRASPSSDSGPRPRAQLPERVGPQPTLAPQPRSASPLVQHSQG